MPLAHHFHGHTCKLPQFYKISLFFILGRFCFVLLQFFAALRKTHFATSLRSQTVRLDGCGRGQDLILWTNILTHVQVILISTARRTGHAPDSSPGVQNHHGGMPWKAAPCGVEGQQVIKLQIMLPSRDPASPGQPRGPFGLAVRGWQQPALSAEEERAETEERQLVLRLGFCSALIKQKLGHILQHKNL